MASLSDVDDYSVDRHSQSDEEDAFERDVNDQDGVDDHVDSDDDSDVVYLDEGEELWALSPYKRLKKMYDDKVACKAAMTAFVVNEVTGVCTVKCWYVCVGVR